MYVEFKKHALFDMGTLHTVLYILEESDCFLSIHTTLQYLFQSKKINRIAVQTVREDNKIKVLFRLIPIERDRITNPDWLEIYKSKWESS
jgi:hypothetical protein